MNVALQSVAADIGIAACATFAGEGGWAWHLLSTSDKAPTFVVNRVMQVVRSPAQFAEMMTDISEVMVEWCVVNQGESA